MADGLKDTHETIEYSKNLPIKLFCQRIGTVEKHWHRSIELLFVLSGTLTVRVENHKYTLHEDDILLINSDQVHDTNSEDCILVLLQMRLSRFHYDGLNLEALYFDCNSTTKKNNEAFDQLREIIARLIQLNSGSSYSQLLRLSYAYHILYLLLHNFLSQSPNRSRPPKHMERLKRIIRYIEENYQKDISLTEIAEREALTPPYLSSFFERNMNTSLTSYIAKIRLNHSFSYLLDTEMSIEEIAGICGFPNQRSYAVLFKKQYGMLPSQYRKANLSAEKKQNSLPMNTPAQYLNLEKYDFYEKLSSYLNTQPPVPLANPALTVSYTFDTKKTVSLKKPLNKNYLNFCSAGRAKELLIGSIQNMLRIQQAEIGFRYIKFHDIFSDELMVYREDLKGNPYHNFVMLDEVFDFLINIGLKPLIQLSFMPKALAKNPDSVIFALPFCISEPKDDSKWSDLVTDFVNHVLARYGFHEVSQWIFTFWNETMTGHPFDFVDMDTFLRLYKITYESVKKCNPDLLVASTSYVSNTFPSENYNLFLEFAKQNYCKPDAYLFHFYPIPNYSDMVSDKAFNTLSLDLSGMLSKDPDSFGRYLKMLNESLPDRDKLPLYITEWNFSSSHREWLNDTCYASAYIARNICRNHELAESFCHWTLTDWIEELDFPEELFHGGIGHFTKNGIKKPAYYAYQFLSELGDEFLAEEEGIFITKDRETYRILLYNYFDVSESYLEGFNFNMSFKNRYEVFPDAADKQFNLELIDVEEGTYLITEKIVNRHYGSCYDKWVEMGSTPLTTLEEINTLRDLSRPFIKKSQIASDGPVLHYYGSLKPHEIRLIILQKCGR